MRIILFAHNLKAAGGLSVGKNLIKTLLEIAPMHEYLVVIPSGVGYPDYTQQSNVEVLECPPMSLVHRFLWERKTLRKTIKLFGPDWIWSLGNVPISNPPCKQSLLFHNPNYVYPDVVRMVAGWKYRLILMVRKWVLHRGLKDTARVYCQTEAMRKRFSDIIHFPLDSISLCPNAFSPHITLGTKIPDTLSHIGKRFLLFTLTRYYAHKNLERIVEMFDRYREELSDVVCVMTISADQGVLAAKLVRKIKALGLEKSILCIGPIKQEALSDYFFASDVMFLPTLLESFSGTYLEAMALDTPILTSDMDFAHVICDAAAHYVDPFSAESMKDGVLALKNDSDLRTALAKKGKQRFCKYLKSWPDIIKEVLDKECISYSRS